jgi:tripartite-type tricarboxylate transporter receptor subunit TctC
VIHHTVAISHLRGRADPNGRQTVSLLDLVPGYEASGWIGISAPRGTPAAIIDKLNSNITAGLADPQLKARIKGLGADPMPMTPTEFGKFMADETEKWANVVKFSGAKAE